MRKRPRHRKPTPKAQAPRAVIRRQPPPHWLDRFEREREAQDEALRKRLEQDAHG
jgi:hypothetical protein